MATEYTLDRINRCLKHAGKPEISIDCLALGHHHRTRYVYDGDARDRSFIAERLGMLERMYGITHPLGQPRPQLGARLRTVEEFQREVATT